MAAQYSKSVRVFDLGLLPYGECLTLQKNIHREVSAGARESSVLLVQHPQIITLGKHASADHVLGSAEELARQGILIERVDRGGDVTAHEPGQLVCYPIVHLPTFKLTPRRLVHVLEQSVIDLASHYNIAAHRLNEYPGVFVGDAKIAAVGIRIRNRVSYHGLSVNIANSMKTFATIIPCGLSDKTVCSLSSLFEKGITVRETLPIFVKSFVQKLGIRHFSIENEKNLMNTALFTLK